MLKTALLISSLICTLADEDTLSYCNADDAREQLLSESDEYRAAFEKEQVRAAKYTKKMEQSGDHTFQKYGENGRRRLVDISIPIIRVPIVFHVLYESDEENLSDAQLNSALRVLNEDFRATRDDIENDDFDAIWASRIADTRIEFEIAGIVRKNVSEARLTQGFVCDDSAKQSSNGGSDGWDQETYANVYMCRLIEDVGAYGYAYFPCLLDTGDYKYADGVMMDIGSMGDVADDDGTFYFRDLVVDRLDGGHILTHEFGHYFNLYHIWQATSGSSCTGEGDYVSDTPFQYGSTAFYCPDDEKNTCDTTDPEAGIDLRDMYENPMDYSLDECKLIFTERQAWRMRATLGEFGCRSQMYENGKYYDCSQELGECSSSPCNETEAGGCVIYHEGQGCSQCGTGYWKKDNNHACISCSDTFGDGCMFCQDHDGCGQCAQGYQREFLHDCGVYACVETGISAVFSCDIDIAGRHVLEDGISINPCHEDGTRPCDCDQVCHCTNCDDGQGCNQCEDGYFKKSNAYPCISCEEYYGDTCLFCQEDQGCGQCRDGCTRYLNDVSGLWDCDCSSDYCAPDTFCCRDGTCVLDISYYNDSYCDCSLCEDEPNYSCMSCREWANEIACPSADHCFTFWPCGF